MNDQLPPNPEFFEESSPAKEEAADSGIPNDQAPPVYAASEIFLEEVAPRPTFTKLLKIPGPGMPEALGWTFGTLFAQIVCGVVAAVVILLMHVFSEAAAGREFDPRHVEHLQKSFDVEFTALSMLFFVIISVAAASLRLLPSPARRIGFRPIAPFHFLLVLLITLPLSFSCTALYAYVDIGWKQLVAIYPSLAQLDNFLSMAMVQELSKRASFPILLLTVAVAPAISEEVIFRGIIGRGLVARWGTVTGIIITSVLFGLVHIHPVHAIAVIPLGMAMHVLYLKTRSFLAPVLLHFLNNGWATVVTKFPDFFGDAANENVLPAWHHLVASAFVVGCLFWLFHQTRVQYLLPDETVWDPGYPAFEAPPAELNAVRKSHFPTPLALACGGVSVCLFAGTVVLG